MAATQSCFIHVAVGIIKEGRRVFIARRDPAKHQGGRWEFPGGKVEVDESAEKALARELLEEINIQVLSCTPLLTISHDYGDKRVFLEVRLVEEYRGKAEGREGQAIRWADIDELDESEFPAANAPIIRQLKLMKN